MSMQPIIMKVALFRGDFDQARSQYSLLWLMEALVRINQSHIRQFRHLTTDKKVPAPYPFLYRAGVHYEPEPGTEEWLDIPNVLAASGGTFPGPWADCEDLACWRTAELREQPKPVAAKPFAKWRLKPDGSYAYHALTLLPDGRLEDPSLVLGMGNEPEFARLRMAERYKEGSLTPAVRYAKKPDFVVIDQSHPSGVSKDIKGAQARTGLVPPPGAPITGIIKGKMPTQVETEAMFPDSQLPTTSDEDGSIYASIKGQSHNDVAAWGYDRASVNINDMRALANYQRQRQRQAHVAGNLAPKRRFIPTVAVGEESFDGQLYDLRKHMTGSRWEIK
jgi:hypothetical protein